MLDEGVIALVPQLFYNHRVETLVPSEKKKKGERRKQNEGRRKEHRVAISRLAGNQ